MTDGHARQLPLTPTEGERFQALAAGESMWIVREGTWTTSPDSEVLAGASPFHPEPPVEFVQACAPCGRCGGKRGWISLGPMEWADCGICAIELVEPCAECGGRGWTVEGQCWPQPEGEQVQCSCDERPVTLGHAYAAGHPLPIIHIIHAVTGAAPSWPNVQINGKNCVTHSDGIDLLAALAHYGQPESLVGQWAIEVRKA